MPAWLDRLIRRGLRTNPKERFPSMQALLDEIARALEPSAPAPVPGRRLARLIPLFAAAGAVALVLAMGTLRSGREPVAGAGAGQCGNGRVEAGEACDDGNRADDDGCLSTCRNATCGDGKLRRGVEQCDDANQTDGDGCSSRCLDCSEGTRAWSGQATAAATPATIAYCPGRKPRRPASRSAPTW